MTYFMDNSKKSLQRHANQWGGSPQEIFLLILYTYYWMKWKTIAGIVEEGK
jgi:hypothetical protein